RDAGRLADRAYEKAVTRVAIAPLATASGNAELGRQVADQWRDDLMRQINPPLANFTRVVGPEAIERAMTVSQLGHLSRDEAARRWRTSTRGARPARAWCGPRSGPRATSAPTRWSRTWCAPPSRRGRRRSRATGSRPAARTPRCARCWRRAARRRGRDATSA